MATNNTPMMAQYLSLKKKHQAEILFFRLGDFYEMFYEDATLVSQELGLALTARVGAPMCGVPYHAAESYIAKLIKKGYKIAICEQVEDAKQTKGIVKREVIKVITPGTVLNETVLAEKESNFLALLAEADGVLSLAATDIATGEFIWTECKGKERVAAICDELYHLMPAELIIAGEMENLARLNFFVKNRVTGCSFTKLDLDYAEKSRALKLPQAYFAPAELPESPSSLAAVGLLLYYVQYAFKNHLSHLNKLTKHTAQNYLVLDASTLRNLEITRNMRDGSKRGTLFAVLDFTKTAMGRRLLKTSLEYPLRDKLKIERRQDAVAELLAKSAARENIGEIFKNIADFERIMTKIDVGTANARDLLALKNSLAQLPQLKNELKHLQAELLAGMALNEHEETVSAIEEAIAAEPPLSVRDGNMIKDGYDSELDELRWLLKDSKKWVQNLENSEREKTGVRSLKIGFNKVFGYYLEVTNANKGAVPASYVRKQTLANAERYITPELKEFETKILGAEEKIVNIEYQLFLNLRDSVKSQIKEIQKTARQIARLDVLRSLSEAAARYNYVRPLLNTEGSLEIKDGRHPVVERLLTEEMFVPNDTFLNNSDHQIMIITGPNMAGKSTYMRQVALLAIMAQMGSFIPAREASLALVDRVFTRVGASDDLASGQSTFMVEMNEVAQIIKYATKESLIILDEIGRGTSTFDGMSIARSVVEYLKNKIGAKTLFATHYHELTDLAEGFEEIKNYSVAVKERGDDVIFLRRIVPGGADKSYGIHVAQLAGLPTEIIDTAKQILKGLEEVKGELPSLRPVAKQSSAKPPSAIAPELLTPDVMTTLPLEAINILSRLKEKALLERGE
ncbi:MAG: DNA mismatch repair protein MutS [Sporomusaceae bacterium]|jgi:DNA mismatch repair protein MutS|nr:DNA mismatch repair protein MutS [Sporomusaceae bacterium]